MGRWGDGVDEEDGLNVKKERGEVRMVRAMDVVREVMFGKWLVVCGREKMSEYCLIVIPYGQ